MKSPTILGLTSIVLAGTMMNAEAITIAHGGDSVDIDFVDIGNAGNTGDTADGFWSPESNTTESSATTTPSASLR